MRELVVSRRNTIPTGGISSNWPLETTAPNCTDRMPIRTSHTGEKRAAGTRFTLGTSADTCPPPSGVRARTRRGPHVSEAWRAADKVAADRHPLTTVP